MKKVTMVTGNLGKWKIASDIFKKYNVELLHEKMDTPEYNLLMLRKFLNIQQYMLQKN